MRRSGTVALATLVAAGLVIPVPGPSAVQALAQTQTEHTATGEKFAPATPPVDKFAPVAEPAAKPNTAAPDTAAAEAATTEPAPPESKAAVAAPAAAPVAAPAAAPAAPDPNGSAANTDPASPTTAVPPAAAAEAAAPLAPSVAPEPGPAAADAPPSTLAPAALPSAATPPANPGVVATTPPVEPAALGQLRALLGPEIALRYRSVTPGADSIQLADAVLTGGFGSLAIAEATFNGVGDRVIRQGSLRGLVLTAKDGTVARLATLELRGLTADPKAPERLTLDRLHLTDLTVPGETEVGLADLTLEDFGSGRPGRVALGGLDVKSAKQDTVDRVEVARISLGGIDLAALMKALAASELPPRGAGDYAFELAEARASLAGKPVGSLAGVTLNGSLAGSIETSRITIKGLRLENSPSLDDWMTRFNYPALVADATSDTRYDRAAGRLEVPALAFGIQDMGAIGLTYSILGATTESAQAMDFDNWRLTGFTLRLADQSFYGRLVRDESRRTGLSEAKVRAGLAAQAAKALGGPKAGGPLLVAVQRFLRGEATQIELTAAPAKPVGLAAVTAAAEKGPQVVLRLLGLTATAK